MQILLVLHAFPLIPLDWEDLLSLQSVLLITISMWMMVTMKKGMGRVRVIPFSFKGFKIFFHYSRVIIFFVYI